MQSDRKRELSALSNEELRSHKLHGTQYTPQLETLLLTLLNI